MSLRTCISAIGNPEPAYRNTRHNVGILILDLLRDTLSPGKPFNKVPRQPNVQQLQVSPELLLLKNAGGFMNVSGHTLSPVWRSLNRTNGTIQHIVLHDELSAPVGKVQWRTAGTSHRGHNGLKDIAKMLPDFPIAKIAIGIGRPDSRDPRDVSNHVLGKFSPAELEILKSTVTDRVTEILEAHMISS